MNFKKCLATIVFLFPFILLAQQEVVGIVKDKTGFPLPGASIVVKGTSTGEITNFDGEFSIKLKTTPSTLLVSYIGFVTKEVEVTNQTQLDIVLEENQEKLNEVVVIGYGSVDKKDLTGSITSIKPKEEIVAQASTIENLLQGQAAGVLVSQNSTEPGGAVSIKIRGTNSLTGNTEPLYVIDGIIVDSASEDTLDPLSGGNSFLSPQGGITGVNPRDIESIEVLKDASATAIYGSRASNGVIIITTKKGKSGEAKFNYSATTKIGEVINNIDMLEANEYAAYVNSYQDINGGNPSYYTYPNGSIALFENDEQYMIDNANTIERLTPVNWSDDIYKTSVSYNHRLSASGGGENSTYYFAAGFMNNEGIIPNQFATKTDFVANLNNDLNDKLKLSTKISANFIKNSASKGTENLGGSSYNIIGKILLGKPFLGDPNNNDVDDDDLIEEGLDGPRVFLEEYDDLSKEIRMLGSTKLDYKISKVFTYRVQLGLDYRNKKRQVYYGPNTFRAQGVGEAGLSTLDRFRYNIDNTLMFKKRISKNHRINGTIGAIIDKSEITRTTNQAESFPNHDLGFGGIGFGENFQPVFYGKEKESIVSFLGRLNYTLKNKYLFTFTFRADGSSKFVDGNRWGYFPAAAFAWKMKEEGFLKDSQTISTAKLRLGWGQTGNQSIPNYRTITPFNPTESPYSDGNNGGITGVIPTNLANPNLTWETASQYNAGIDLGFFEDRIVTSVDVYYKDISDLLIFSDIPDSNGYNNLFANQGGLTNKGIELSLNADVIDKKKFKWNVYGNISFNRNEITNLGLPPSTFGSETFSAYTGSQISGGNYFKVPANIFIEGQPAGLFYGYQTQGIISTDEELASAATPSFYTDANQLGDVHFVDQNGDGIINDSDLTTIGDPNPDFNYGFGSSVSYNGISLSFFFNGVYGNDIANGGAIRYAYADDTVGNVRSDAYHDAWSPENPNGSFPRVGYPGSYIANAGFTDRQVEDGSFMRLSYVTLGYEIPTQGISFIDNASVSVSGQNLLLFTDYSGFDPEVNSFSYDPSRVGVDWNSFPNQRSFSVGLNVSF